MGNKVTENKGGTVHEEVIFMYFWQITPDGKLSIHHEGLLDFIRGRGFCWMSFNGTKRLVKVEGKIIADADITDINNCVYRFINTDTVPEKLGYGATKKDLLNLFTRGIDNYINVPKLRLLPIRTLPIHRDTKTSSFFYCKNDVVQITADSMTTIGYNTLDGYVWKEQIKQHNFQLLHADQKGDFETFAYRICDKNDTKFESLQTILGYLLHRHWPASNPIIPCFLDETVVGDEEAQGGTGKSLLCYALSYIRSMVDVDGKNFKAGTNFAFQRVTQHTELLFVDDLHRGAVFEDWFAIATGGIEVNQKFKAAFRIERAYSPKIVLTSNFPIRTIAGFSGERRKLEFEVGKYYGKHRQPKDEFDKEFFQGWDENDYNQMLNFFARCVQKYLAVGIIEPPSVNGELRKLITELGGSDLLMFLDEKIGLRVKSGFVKQDLYEEFLKANPGQNKYYPSRNRFILKLHKYLAYHGIQYTEMPKNTKARIEITNWGDIPEPEPTDENMEDMPMQGDDEDDLPMAGDVEDPTTLSNVAHTYTVIETPSNETE
ncbi:MAG: hypothetical protein WBM13_07375 [Bacteroidia bacterium]